MAYRSIMVAATVLAGAAPAQLPTPPVAAKVPHGVTAPFGATRQDEYYWMRDDSRKDPKLIAHLTAENAYADAVLAPTRALKGNIYREIVGRIRQDDSSVPYRDNGYFYYSRFATGADYPVIARRKGAMTASEEVLLDQPKLAAGKGYFSAAGGTASPDNRLYAWAEDVIGRRQYVLKVKNLATGAMLADVVENIEPGFVWADDNRTLYYVEKDPKTLLSKRVKAHVLGTPASADRLVYEETDDSFYMGLGRTTSEKYVCIYLASTVSDEQRCTPAATPGAFAVVAPRLRDFRYDADHIGDHWVMRTNWDAPDYRIMTVPDTDLTKGRDGWRPLVPMQPGVFIEGVKPFDGYLTIEERSGGNKRLRILTDAGQSSFVASDEPAYTMAIDTNREHDTPWVRYSYGSLTTPATTYEVNAVTGERRLLKVQPTPGYDKAHYVTERLWVAARDGTKVPVSLFYRKGLKKDGTAALFQYGYGSYGNSMDPGWTNYAVSLADRGMVYAIAHVRGGQELGRAWYDDGHLMKKRNSFTDFIDVTRGLVAQGYAAKDRVAAMGGSAGGLLMGAVANMAPADYRVMVAQVPFVDVVTTMLDASIPLTTNEYDEWGNPAQKPAYDYMLGYSPYDNVTRQAYPTLFVGTGLWDSQVQYFEPAKWVARLRATKTDANPVLFRVNMEAGHGGKSGRFRRYEEQAEYLAFVVDRLGAAGPVATAAAAAVR